MQLSAQAQTRDEAEHEAAIQISNELEAVYGPNYYGASRVHEVDSLLGFDGYFLNPLEDPYGTLKGCFVFAAGPKDDRRNIVGVCKNGHILWRSDTLNCLSDLDLFTTRDLNGEGMVDLVFQAENQQGLELWIFSWDGRAGKRINAVNSDGSSAIEIDWGYGHFSFIDVEGNGQWEIRGRVSEDTCESWSWNGHEYGQWPNTPNTNIVFPPTNRFDLDVCCQVSSVGDSLWYKYELYNKPTSKQRVEDIRIWSNCRNAVGVSSPPYWGYSSRSGRGYGWDTWVDYTTGQIRVGKRMSGFEVKAKALCGIVDFDSHGYNGIGWNKAWVEKPGNFTLMMKDLLNNAVTGKTIGPVDPPNPFVAADFLDTLVSYKRESVAQGWLTDSKTCKPDCDNIMNGRDWYMQGSFQQYDKWNPDNTWNFDRDWNNGVVEVLDARLIKAGVELSKKDSVDARQDLEIFVMEVEMLNDVSAKLVIGRQTSIMTSEAYALLKYNAEYLIDNLPAGRQRQ